MARLFVPVGLPAARRDGLRCRAQRGFAGPVRPCSSEVFGSGFATETGPVLGSDLHIDAPQVG